MNLNILLKFCSFTAVTIFIDEIVLSVLKFTSINSQKNPMSDQKRVFLVDAFALIFRGYYAFIKNPRINSKGLDTSAIMGFMNSLLDVIKRERPDHLAVCFDKGGSVDRVEMF